MGEREEVLFQEEVEETVFIPVEVIVKQEYDLNPQIDLTGKLSCGKCAYFAKTNQDLNRHKESVHMELPSNVEAKIAASEARGIPAEVGEDGRLYYHCTMCDYKSVRNDTIKGHIDRKHLLLRPYSATKPHNIKDKHCEDCEYSTGRSICLSRHRERVHGAPPSEEDAEKRTRDAESLGLLVIKGEEGELIFSCNICGHRGSHPGSVRSHRTRKHERGRTKLQPTFT